MIKGVGDWAGDSDAAGRAEAYAAVVQGAEAGRAATEGRPYGESGNIVRRVIKGVGDWAGDSDAYGESENVGGSGKKEGG